MAYLNTAYISSFYEWCKQKCATSHKVPERQIKRSFQPTIIPDSDHSCDRFLNVELIDNSNNNNVNKKTQNVVFPLWKHYLFFILRLRNIIDFLTWAPLYLNATGDMNANALLALRIIRLIRLGMILFKGAITTVLYRTMVDSFDALLFILIFSLFAVIVFGFFIFLAESGRFQVSTTYPTGAYVSCPPSILNLKPI